MYNHRTVNIIIIFSFLQGLSEHLSNLEMPHQEGKLFFSHLFLITIFS